MCCLCNLSKHYHKYSNLLINTKFINSSVFNLCMLGVACIFVCLDCAYAVCYITVLLASVAQLMQCSNKFIHRSIANSQTTTYKELSYCYIIAFKTLVFLFFPLVKTILLLLLFYLYATLLKSAMLLKSAALLHCKMLCHIVKKRQTLQLRSAALCLCIFPPFHLCTIIPCQ